MQSPRPHQHGKACSRLELRSHNPLRHSALYSLRCPPAITEKHCGRGTAS